MLLKQKHHKAKRRDKPEEKAAKVNLLAAIVRMLASLIDLIHQ